MARRHAARVPVGTGCSDGDCSCLLPTDVTWAANRVSCDQDIASDGFFSLGMIARFESALRERASGSIGGCSGSAG